MKKLLKTEICVIGGGSGGFAAALRAAQAGSKTILVEKEHMLGGNSTVCGVNCWEPVVGSACGLPRELYQRMRQIPNGCGIYHYAKHLSLDDPEKKNFPGGLFKINTSLGYDDTLKRGFIYGAPYKRNLEYWNGVIFESLILDRCIRQMLREAGCRIIAGHACVKIENHDGHITAVQLDDGRRIEAKYWIDNCGFVAASAGCKLFMGQDAKSLYHEPDAPERSDISYLNGVTLIFRISPTGKVKSIVSEGTSRRSIMVATEYPNGDYNCNMLPTMQGTEFFSLDRESAMKEMYCRVRDFWCYVQENFQWGRNFKLAKIFSRPGIRESFRIQCRYMLNENDIIAGLKSQEHRDMIVIADHQMDLHGIKNPDRIVYPYGIPYRSLLPENIDNLLVVGRIAGFSCLASSSCRLSRTIIRLGEAAGHAVALSLQGHCELCSINIKELQERIRFREEQETAYRGIIK